MKKLVLTIALGLLAVRCKKETITKDTTTPSNTYRIEVLSHEVINNQPTPTYTLKVFDNDSLIHDVYIHYDDSLITYEWSRPDEKVIQVLFNGYSYTDTQIKLFKNGQLKDIEQGYDNVALLGVH